MDVEQAIREGLTYKAFALEPIDRATLDGLFERAVGAQGPPHQPVALLCARPDALEHPKEAAGPAAAAKLDRTLTLVAATVVASGDPVQDEEDLCAAACATYAILLGAHARRLVAHAGVLCIEAGARRWASVPMSGSWP